MLFVFLAVTFSDYIRKRDVEGVHMGTISEQRQRFRRLKVDNVGGAVRLVLLLTLLVYHTSKYIPCVCRI